MNNQLSHGGTGPATPDWERLVPWAPLLFAAIAFLCWGARPLWDPSEARYGQAAFEMMSNDHWLTPTLGGVPHLTKPPLSYWLIGAGMNLFGVNPWGARFFLSVSFFLTILAVQYLGRSMGFEPRKAVASALIYATAAIPFAAGHTLTTDGFLVLWETIGILAAWRVWHGAPQRHPLWRLIFWGAFGLAFLTKGPPGCLPLLVVPLFLRLRRGDPLPPLFSVSGLVLFLSLALSWYGLMIWQQSGLLDYFVGNEFFKRIFTSEHHRNAPFWIYAPVLFFGMTPWLPLWYRLIKEIWRHRPGGNRCLDDWQLFLALWFLIPLTIFTAAQSRLVFYVLPLFVPLSLGFGHLFIEEFPRLTHRPGWRRTAGITATLWLMAMLFYTSGTGLFFPDRSLNQAAAIFTRAAANAEPSTPLYWIWAGRQRYSLAFSMHRVIVSTETILPCGDSEENSLQPLYVTEEQTLAAAATDGRLTSLRPVVLARAQSYALFSVRQEADQ